MKEEKILKRLQDCIVNLDIDGIGKAAQDALDAGIPR